MLLQNGYRDGLSPLRRFGAGILVNGAYPQTSQYLTGAKRNIFAGEAGIDSKSSQPAGARPPVAWQMAQEAGGMSSRNAARVEISNTASAVMGLPASASVTVALDASATGGLVVSASGSANITLSVTGTILSVASASGSATVTLTPTGLLGALAGLSASANVTLTPAGNISALGYMSGLSTSETEFSEAALARAVWTAQASDYNTSGTMGEKMNSAGGGSSPTDIAQGVWEYIVESGFEAQEVLRILAAVAAGDATGLEGYTPVFKDLSGTKNRITANYLSGTRTIQEIDVT